jgi:acyl carrier protein
VSNSVAERVKQVMSLTFNVPAETIRDNASRQEMGEWDSIGHANLLLGLEEEFGAMIPDDVMPTLKSVDAIVAYFSSLEGAVG